MEKKETIPVIPLVKKQDIFNLIVTEPLERKIRHLCMKQPDNEWSGTLFYEPEGRFEDGSLVIKCIDICLMDIGTSAYTEFDMSSDVISYAMEHDLLGVQMGLIHSHDKMSTFFSNTDTTTLKEEGLDRNHFVSLIVNNEGSYTAGITRRVKSKKTVTDVYSYQTFEGKEVNENKSYEVETEELEWYELKITIEKDNSFEELDSRLKEISEVKKAKAAKTVTTPYNVGYKYYGYDKYKKEPTLFDVPTVSKTIEVPTSPANKVIPKDFPYTRSLEDFSVPYEYVHFDKEVIKSLVLQLITGSIIIPNESKINIYKWAAGMTGLYEKRFGKGKQGMQLFEMWADSYIEFICLNTTNEELNAQGYSEEEISAICANDIMESLSDLPTNEYIEKFNEILLNYII